VWIENVKSLTYYSSILVKFDQNSWRAFEIDQRKVWNEISLMIKFV
jgi:hypothetical protein